MVERSLALGDGTRVPYPMPSSAVASRIGRANRRSGTGPELRVRSALHRSGLRFRVDFQIEANGLKVRPDVVFTRRRVALFVDGCFWHCCQTHGTSPGANASYWAPKLARNVERDRAVDSALGNAGWVVIRVWEHEPVPDVLQVVQVALDTAAGTRR